MENAEAFKLSVDDEEEEAEDKNEDEDEDKDAAAVAGNDDDAAFNGEAKPASVPPFISIAAAAA